MPTVPVPPPAPEDASTWAEFTAMLRALHEWCGSPKYRALCRRCPGLSPAAVSNLIGRNPLSVPPETATARFVEACLRFGEWPSLESEVAKWVAHRRLLADPGSVVEAAPPRRFTWRGGRFAVAGAVMVVVAGTVWAVARGADAGCRQVSGSIEDSRTQRTWDRLFQCPNRPRVAVYEKAGFGTEVAVLETDPSWFICWTRGQRHSGGNDVWYYTQGDRSTGKPELDAGTYPHASDLRVGDAPDPAITRHC